MYQPARKFVHHLQAIIVMGEQIGVTSREDAFADILQYLQWEISEELTPLCIEAGLDELYDEMVGEG